MTSFLKKTTALLLICIAFILTSCSPSGNVNATFDNVSRITIENIDALGERNLVVELSDEETINKIISGIDLEKNGTAGCEFQLVLTFHKENTTIEGFANIRKDCSSIAYTYNSNFYTMTITEEGAHFLTLLTGAV